MCQQPHRGRHVSLRPAVEYTHVGGGCGVVETVAESRHGKIHNRHVRTCWRVGVAMAVTTASPRKSSGSTAGQGGTASESTRLTVGSMAVGVLVALAVFSVMEAQQADRQGKDSMLDQLTGATRQSRNQARTPTSRSVLPPQQPAPDTAQQLITGVPPSQTTTGTSSPGGAVYSPPSSEPQRPAPPPPAVVSPPRRRTIAVPGTEVSGLDWTPPPPFAGVSNNGSAAIANRTFNAEVWKKALAAAWSPTVKEAPMAPPKVQAGADAAVPLSGVRWKPALCSFAELRTQEYAQRGCARRAARDVAW